jgi:glycine hydroxymethyltransferase
MGLGLPDGGHLTHGFYVRLPSTIPPPHLLMLPQTAKKKISASSIYFQSFPYALDPATQYIDYKGLTSQANLFKPRLIVCGASAYPRDWDYASLKKVAESHDAWLLADIAHTSGLVAAQELNNPFEYCDVVTTTTFGFPGRVD